VPHDDIEAAAGKPTLLTDYACDEILAAIEQSSYDVDPKVIAKIHAVKAQDSPSY
jgi:hypothetical protein